MSPDKSKYVYGSSGHPAYPKQRKSFPFGMGQTPFDPRTGKHLGFAETPELKLVAVGTKVGITENIYQCTVLDKNCNKTSEKIHVRRLVYGDIEPADIVEDTALFAYKIEKKWWMQAGTENEFAAPTVDFTVDLFDRSDVGNLGTYWDNNSFMSVNNGVAWTISKNIRQHYLAKLSSANYTFSMDYGIGDMDTFKDHYDNLAGGSTGTYNHTLFLPLIGYSASSDSGILVYSYVRMLHDYSNPPYNEGLWYRYYFTIYYWSEGGVGSSIYGFATDYVKATGYSSINTNGSIQININDKVFTISGTYPYNLSTILPSVFNTEVGLVTSSSNYAEGIYVDNFKAWVSSIPEPSSTESGHGKYLDGQHVYSDKYHASGTYNPNA